MEVVVHPLAAGIPLRKANYLRPMPLEKRHLQLVSSTHLHKKLFARWSLRRPKQQLLGEISPSYLMEVRGDAMMIRYAEEEELADGRRLAI